MSLVELASDPAAAAHTAISWVGERVEQAATLDWVLLLAAVAILYYLGKCVIATTRVGPVEVETLDCDVGKVEVHALTAMLRERVSSSGLSAPVVPSGAPQASLIAAVAASPIPEAGFIAKVLEALPIPEPPSYRLSGTLFERGELTRTKPGISFWLRPDRGQPLMRTSVGKGVPSGFQVDYGEVIKSTAFEAYSFISTAATQAFPTWTRWHSAEALEDYELGSSAAAEQRFAKALTWLTSAELREPDNALLQLQLANVHERRATGVSFTDREDRAKKQAEALRRYLWVADEWAWLVQARYRASVLAALLAGQCTDDRVRAGIVDGLGLKWQTEPEDPGSGEADVASIVKDIAKSQSESALQLLRPWYMLLRWRRLRSQFEPKSEERRQLKRAVAISRHCQRLRALNPSRERHIRCWNWLKVRYSEAAVRWWHLSLGSIRTDWQTHYVAACFESLLLERALKLQEGASDD